MRFPKSVSDHCLFFITHTMSQILLSQGISHGMCELSLFIWKKTVRLSFTFILPFYLCFISEQENVFTCSVSLIFKQAKNFILPVTNHQHSKQQTCCSKHIQGHTLKKKHKLLHQACSLLFIEESGFHVKVLDKTFS